MSAPMKIDDEWVEKAGRAIYDAENGLDGDQIAEVIGSSDYLDGFETLDVHTAAVIGICRLAAEAALSAVAPLIRAAALEEAAKVIDPKDARPCGCTHCHCNSDWDAEQVAHWDDKSSLAADIRALATTGERPNG